MKTQFTGESEGETVHQVCLGEYQEMAFNPLMESPVPPTALGSEITIRPVPGVNIDPAILGTWTIAGINADGTLRLRRQIR